MLNDGSDHTPGSQSLDVAHHKGVANVDGSQHGSVAETTEQ